MEKAASITVEIDETVLRELQEMATHTGQALSALLQELTQEALRMRHYPGIVFTEGPAGRRATLLEPGLKKGKGDRLLFLGFFGVLQKVVLEKVACPLLSPLLSPFVPSFVPLHFQVAFEALDGAREDQLGFDVELLRMGCSGS